jgi:hypothetical protein
MVGNLLSTKHEKFSRSLQTGCVQSVELRFWLFTLLFGLRTERILLAYSRDSAVLSNGFLALGRQLYHLKCNLLLKSVAFRHNR